MSRCPTSSDTLKICSKLYIVKMLAARCEGQDRRYSAELEARGIIKEDDITIDSCSAKGPDVLHCRLMEGGSRVSG